MCSRLAVGLRGGKFPSRVSGLLGRGWRMKTSLRVCVFRLAQESRMKILRCVTVLRSGLGL